MFLEQYKGNCPQQMTIANLHLEQRYGESTRQFLDRFTEVTEQVQELDSKQAANFFVRGLINGSLAHERFIETPPKDMNEVRTKVEGIIRVEENRQRTAKNATIAVAQNNTPSNFVKKPEGKQQRAGGGTELKKRPAENRENAYNCNPQKRFKPEEEGFDYTFIMPQEKIFAELKDQNIF